METKLRRFYICLAAVNGSRETDHKQSLSHFEQLETEAEIREREKEYVQLCS